ncbi:hypothetical protein NC653_023027 [Populus alba x Populus x berolinensis]|uniref:Uncharacterized protein n=1 Tax=Populus alba x Populus x berolinensis TaxID=444605 RepID=A0AAD6MG41_9ROSI|nr:hypothetical protein NC653_023027 [Populus alba x Populus x berolinensis]
MKDLSTSTLVEDNSTLGICVVYEGKPFAYNLFDETFGRSSIERKEAAAAAAAAGNDSFEKKTKDKKQL